MSFYKTTRFIFIGVLILSVFFSPMVSFAIYQPGETLDPDCAPGDSDCAVQFTLNSQQGQYYTPIMQFLTMNTPVKHPSNPILAFGESGTCDAVSLVDPTVVKESDGTYKMWYIGYSGSGSSHRTCFATSNDGINWTKSLSNPVMSEGSSGTYDAYLWENRVIKDGSTYKMWYQSADLSGDARFRTSYATSPDGVTWTKYAGNPIFEGGEGKWDQDYAGFRDVIKVGSTYHAWYEARTGSEDFAVGYATSTDGITWTKVSVDEPVLQGDAGEWDDYTIIPNVVRYNDMFLMFYSTHMDNNTGKIGLATSVDGETWTKYAHNPIMDLMDGAESWENTLGTTVTEVIQDSTSSPSFLLYYRGRNSSNNFQTGVVRFDPFATDKNVLINNNSVNPALHVYQSGAGSALFVESGNVGIGTSSPTQQLSLTNAIALVNTTDSTTGVIYKGADRFLHNFAGSGTNGANVFIGKNSGNFTMGGTTNEASYNTALGEATLTNLTTGSYNTGIGNSALNANTTGTGNTALGDETMIANTTGGYNTAVGVGSLYSNTTGDNNIAVGFALFNNTIGARNTALGYQAGHALTEGNNNILLGYQAGNNLTTGSGNIIIGHDIDAPSITSANTLSIGNLIYATGLGATGTTVSTGNVGIGTASPSKKLSVVGDIGMSSAYFIGVNGSSATPTNSSSAIRFNDGGLANSAMLSFYASTGLGSSNVKSAYGFNGSVFNAGIGSNNHNFLDLSYTANFSGNQSGTLTGIYLDATETNLNSSAHNLMDLKVGGVSKFVVNNEGNLRIGSCSISLTLCIEQDSIKAFVVNTGDRIITLGSTEGYDISDHFEGIKISQFDTNPIIQIGSSGNTGNGTIFTLNDNDGVINIGRVETVNADGIEGIQISNIASPLSSSPIVKIGSSSFTGNGTLLTVNDVNQMFDFTTGSASRFIIKSNGNVGIGGTSLPELFTSLFQVGFPDETRNYFNVNDVDEVINIGRSETLTNDGIEGIQISIPGGVPTIKIGSTGYIGSSTLLTVSDQTQNFTFVSGNNELLNISSYDYGNGSAGPVITLGRNTNATNTGAGSINFLAKGGTSGYVWQDAAGNMRIHTSAPSNANDTAGTVIGAQTSTRDTKQNIEDYEDYGDALDKILNTPLHTFRYIKEVEGYGTDSPLAKTRLGYIADEVDPIFMVGNVIDQVSVNGILIASIKALNLKLNDINNLEKENSWRDALVGWFGNMANGIGDFFANRIRTKTICLGEEGNETCITKSQLDQMLNNINSSQTIIINNGGSSNTTEENTDENITENITEDIDTSTDTENTTEDTDTSIDTEDVVSETIDEADNIDPEDTSDQIEESNTSVEVNIDTSTDTETIVDTTSELY